MSATPGAHPPVTPQGPGVGQRGSGSGQPGSGATPGSTLQAGRQNSPGRGRGGRGRGRRRGRGGRISIKNLNYRMKQVAQSSRVPAASVVDAYVGMALMRTVIKVIRGGGRRGRRGGRGRGRGRGGQQQQQTQQHPPPAPVAHPSGPPTPVHSTAPPPSTQPPQVKPPAAAAHPQPSH